MMLMMVVLSVLSAAVAKLIGLDAVSCMTGVVLIVAGPMGVMIAYSLMRQWIEARQRRRSE
jgi:hypothetical protein